MGLPYCILNFSALPAWYNFILCAVPSCELCFNDFSSFDTWFSYEIVFVHCNLFHCVLYSTFSPVNMKFFIFVYEMKMNNLLVDVEIFVNKFYFKRSFNHINGGHGPLFSQINFDQTYFRGFCLGVYVLEPQRIAIKTT